ncbi:MAG: hypothetical protein EKK29_21095 [Hyphomicrobiales bacterium]|nr:MAG: hypothetical protein EKK29_21095 [Hyphomicrobiales bacterium]
MSGFEQKDRRPRPDGSGNVWSVAALSAAVFLCSLLAAKVLSRMVESGEFTAAAHDDAISDVLRKAEHSPRLRTILGSVGIDGVVTATIPRRAPAPVSPCGEEKGGGKAGK